MDDHVKQLLLLGREHYQKRELDKAEYLLRQVVATTDRFADVFDMLGVISHSKGDFAQAERYFEKAVSLPRTQRAQLNLWYYNDSVVRRARDITGDRIEDLRPASRPLATARSPTCTRGHQPIRRGQDAGCMFELERAVALCPFLPIDAPSWPALPRTPNARLAEPRRRDPPELCQRVASGRSPIGFEYEPASPSRRGVSGGGNKNALSTASSPSARSRSELRA